MTRSGHFIAKSREPTKEEFLLLGRPVLALGNTFYQEVKGVTRVGDLRDLPRLIQKALEAPPQPRNHLLRLVAAYLRGTYPAEIQSPKGEPVLDEANVERLVAVLARELALEQR